MTRILVSSHFPTDRRPAGQRARSALDVQPVLSASRPRIRHRSRLRSGKAGGADLEPAVRRSGGGASRCGKRPEQRHREQKRAHPRHILRRLLSRRGVKMRGCASPACPSKGRHNANTVESSRGTKNLNMHASGAGRHSQSYPHATAVTCLMMVSTRTPPRSRSPPRPCPLPCGCSRRARSRSTPTTPPC